MPENHQGVWMTSIVQGWSVYVQGLLKVWFDDYASVHLWIAVIQTQEKQNLI